ncbi:hypothetical protein [uncultured Winogradskyella sp.]|nr:hypothetical protein [uncultured Winogradskyella sp.]
MKFVKEDEEERRDYIFQKDKKTVYGARFIAIVLILLIVAVAVTYFTLG